MGNSTNVLADALKSIRGFAQHLRAAGAKHDAEFLQANCELIETYFKLRTPLRG